MTETDSGEMLAELRAIWGGLLLPGDRWHPWASELARLREDVATAFTVLEVDAAACSDLARILEATEEPASDAGADDRLGATRRMLSGLPRPDGKHPFLEHILPALEVAEAIFAAVGGATAARTRFNGLAGRG